MASSVVSLRMIPPSAVTMPYQTLTHRGSAINTGNSSFHCKDITHPEVKQAAQVLNAWPIENLGEVRKRLAATNAKLLVDVALQKDDSIPSPYELAFTHPGALGLFETNDGTRDGMRSKIRYFTKFNQIPDNLPDPYFVGVVDENAAAPTGSTITCHGIRPTWNTTDGDVFPGDDLYWEYPRTEYDHLLRAQMPVARTQPHLPQTGARARLVVNPWRNGGAYPEQLRQYFTGELAPGDNTANSFACLRDGMDWIRMLVPADYNQTSVLSDIFSNKLISENDLKNAGSDKSRLKELYRQGAEEFARKYAPDHLFPGQQAHWSQTLRDISWKRLEEAKLADTRLPFIHAMVQTVMIMSAVVATRFYEVMHRRYVGQAVSFAAQGEMVHILLK